MKQQFNDNQRSSHIQSSLSEEQYNNLLNHINLYIETTLTEKANTINDKITTPQLKLLIGSIVKETIVHHKYELSNMEIDRIVAAVQLKLNENFSAKDNQFSARQLDQIIKIVEDRFAQLMEKQEAAKHMNVEEILLLILSSQKMVNLVDQRLLMQLSPEKKLVSSHQTILTDLKFEIDQLKATLLNKAKENEDLHSSLAALQDHQHSLAVQLATFETGYKDKFNKLLNDVDLKLSDLNSNRYAGIDDRIKIILMEITGYANADNTDLSNVDIKRWIHSVFVSKEFLEAKLNEFMNSMDEKMMEEMNRSAGILMKNISDQIKHEILVSIEQNRQHINVKGLNNGINRMSPSNFSEDYIRKIVKDALAVYDADKTGLVDFALESSGGEILSTRCTENYRSKSAQVSIFGIPLWYQTNTPRTVISPTVQPGQCWAFQGFPGFLVLKLNCNVFVTGFTLEHIPKSLAPKGRIDSAPNLFTIWGLDVELDPEPHQFGTYEYQENGTSLQYFRVQNDTIDRPFNIVELRIESNHGNTNYTCLYRFRVHGTPAT